MSDVFHLVLPIPDVQLQLVLMANLVDSAAYFDARATEYGVPDALLTLLNTAGFTTLGHLAFAVNRPGQETDDARFDARATRINNNVAPALGAVAALKRLHVVRAFITETYSFCREDGSIGKDQEKLVRHRH